MRFNIEMILRRYEFIPFQFNGICSLLYGFYKYCINAVVLAIILTAIDLYIYQMTSAEIVSSIKNNALVSIVGLLTLRIVFLVLSSHAAELLLSMVIRDYSLYEFVIRIISMIASAVVIYYAKSYYLIENGESDTYSTFAMIANIYLILNLRSSLSGIGITCGR